MRPFESAVYYVIRELQPEAYGVPIRQRLEQSRGFVSYGELFVALDNLQEAGMIESELRQDDDRKRRYYRTTLGSEERARQYATSSHLIFAT